MGMYTDIWIKANISDVGIAEFENCNGVPTATERAETLWFSASFDGSLLTVCETLRNYDGDVSEAIDWVRSHCTDPPGIIIAVSFYEADNFPIIYLSKEPS